MKNKEKFYIAAILLFATIALYFAVKANRKVEIRFSKPVSLIGNFGAPDNSIWGNKQ